MNDDKKIDLVIQAALDTIGKPRFPEHLQSQTKERAKELINEESKKSRKQVFSNKTRNHNYDNLQSDDS